jgi:hypothetical protein
MSYKNQVLFLFFILITTVVIGQATSSLPKLIPPSPEVAQLVKLGNLSTGMHTGAANVDIPLVEVNTGNLKLPISLQYSTNGIRVNEIASRVGLSWNLVAGGSISRTVHDEDDLDIGVTQLSPPASFNADNGNTALVNYVSQALYDNYDTEKDEYAFSVNGLSGKFYIANTGQPKQITHSNMRVEKVGNYFVVTEATGNKYYFGTNSITEKTKSFDIHGNNRWDKFAQTGWFLTKIAASNGEEIIFDYAPITIKTMLGPSQSEIATPANNQIGSECSPNPCTPSGWGVPNFNFVEYNTHYLTSITTNTGIKIYFVYESRNDIGGDNRLKRLLVHQISNGVSKQIKDYSFNYEDRPIVGETNKRFYLKEILTNPCNEIWSDAPSNLGLTTPPLQTTPLMHEFEYNVPENLPSQYSLNQDYFGYANAANNTQHFIPKHPSSNYSTYLYAPQGADREPYFPKMVAGSLKKVKYPTGGTEEFEYEQHRLPEQAYNYAYTNTSIQGRGKQPAQSPNVYNFNFTSTATLGLKVHLVTSNNPTGPFAGQNGYWYPEDGHPLLELRLKRVSDNVTLVYKKHDVYANENVDYSSYLLPNTQYKIELSVYGLSTYGIANIQYNPTVTPYWNNKPVCGIRVKKIVAYDPVTNKYNNKIYKYHTVNDPAKSSGFGQIMPDFFKEYINGGVCMGSATGTTGYYECSNFVQFSSSSISDNVSFGSSPIAYKTVIETDDENFANGMVEHDFRTETPYAGAVPILGITMPALPTSMNTTLDGTETKTTYYKKIANGYKILKTIENFYDYDTRVGSIEYNYLIRRRFGGPGNPFQYVSENLKPYDVCAYTYRNAWSYLTSTVTKEYSNTSNDYVEQTINYTYDNIAVALPTKVTTANSKGQMVVSENYYPTYFNIPPYTNMVAKNIISPIVQTKQYKNNNLLSTTTTNYVDWLGNGNIILPQTIEQQKGNMLNEIRLRYHSLNSVGKPLQVSKEAGTNMAYIWDYNGRLPIAEVQNAAANDIAYTSFENLNNRGNWVVGGSQTNDPNADLTQHWIVYEDEGVTGKYAFGGRLTKTLNPSQQYTITIWSKNGATVPTVNNIPGSFMQTKVGWSLYKWNITTQANVVIQGNKIDEVRLYPTAATMVTYTYFPNVGITTMANAANYIVYYQYDNFGRLLLVRDIDKNIVKQYDYKYWQHIAPCASTAPQWELTGNTRCEISPITNTYTGIKQAEERNENNCSSTYLQTRWATIPTPQSECLPGANCNGADKRMVNAVCETGVKIFMSSTPAQTGQWICTYKYVWSDGYESGLFTEISNVNCTPILTDI